MTLTIDRRDLEATKAWGSTPLTSESSLEDEPAVEANKPAALDKVSWPAAVNPIEALRMAGLANNDPSLSSAKPSAIPIGAGVTYTPSTSAAPTTLYALPGIGVGAAKRAPLAPAVAYPAFAKLPASTQAELATRMATHASDPTARTNLTTLATDPAFAKLSPDQQKLMIEAFDKAPADKKLVADLLTLARSKSFSHLDSDTANDVIKRMGRTDPTERANYLRLGTSDGFSRLSRAHQKQLLAVMDKKPADAGLASDLEEAANSGDFRLLSDEAKTEVIAGLGRLKDDAPARRTLLDLAKTPGLRAMKTEDSMAILRVAGGTSSTHSAPARAELRALLADPGFAGMGEKDQAKRLGKFIADQRFLPGTMEAPPGTFKGTVKPKIIGPATKPFSSDKVYGVVIDGRTIMVTVKKPPAGMVHHSIDEIAAGLAATPKDTRDKITSIELSDSVHPTTPDAYAGSNSTGKVTFYPGTARAQTANFMASAMVHEMGHAISGKRWGDDTNNPSWQGWKDAMAKDRLSPSQYAHTTPGVSATAGNGTAYADDFAESWLLYQRVKGTPQEAEMRRLFPERFKIMDTF